MSGRKGRSGRRPLPVELHLARGSFRPGRHQHLLDAATAAVAPTSPTSAVLDGLGEAGRALVQQHVAEFDAWDVRALHYLRQAGEQRDRQAALAAAINAAGAMTEAMLPMLRAERQAASLVLQALRQIDLTDAAPAGATTGLLERLRARAGA